MILVDANIWIAHFDIGEPALAQMLPRREALVHPYTIGEMALGHLRMRAVVLAVLALLPGIVVARHEEVMQMIETRSISRIGYVDAHLLASTLLVPGVRLWTRDKRLRKVAERLNIAADLA